jgi:hypothetical protein
VIEAGRTKRGCDFVRPVHGTVVGVLHAGVHRGRPVPCGLGGNGGAQHHTGVARHRLDVDGLEAGLVHQPAVRRAVQCDATGQDEVGRAGTGTQVPGELEQGLLQGGLHRRGEAGVAHYVGREPVRIRKTVGLEELEKLFAASTPDQAAMSLPTSAERS